MRQALHIFREDVRHLWQSILVVLAATAGFAFEMAGQAASLTDPTQGVALSRLAYVLPVAWWALIARLIYDEPLAEDQPFWLTRPYSRRSLLAAKVLFIAAFVNLPVCAADLFIVRAWGFPVWPVLGGVLWRQVLLTTLFVLPVVALCAVTTGLVQLITSVIILGLAVAEWAMAIDAFGAGAPWLALEWTRSYCAGVVVAVAALAVIVLQYARRDTARSRLVAGGAVVSAFLVLAFLPWTAAFALQSRVSRQTVDSSRIRVSFDPDMKWAARALVNKDDRVDIQIPVRITGIPAPLVVVTEGIAATIEGPGRAVWRSGPRPQSNLRSIARVGSAFYNRVKNDPIRIHGSAYLTLYGNMRATILPVRDQPVLLPTPGAGLCSAGRTGEIILLTCRSAFKSQPDMVTFAAGRSPWPALVNLTYPRPISYSPFPADANLIPVSQSVQVRISNPSGSPISVRAVALEPVAHIRKDFEITGLRLADFETK